MMGSGGLVVMDEDTCMVDIAKYFLSFTQCESCGKCTPCREGTLTMLSILTKITQGQGTEQDLLLLEELGDFIGEISLCGLGKTAPNPVLSTLRYFRDEYLQHVKYKRCPAMVCRDLIFTPCKASCPLDTAIPTFIAQISRRQYKRAFETIRKNNPFPITTSLICHHPCEFHCPAGLGQGAISIKGLKRFACEKAVGSGGFGYARRARCKHKEQVAVIGAGPAGLAAAYDLRKNGYGVTVYDAAPKAGGMVTAAIPSFRLPQHIMDMEIKNIRQTGVKVKTRVTIGADLSLEDLLHKGFRAVLIATGAHRSRKLTIPGAEKAGSIEAIPFLKNAKSGKGLRLGAKVAVIGGGNSAVDAARTAWRLGSQVFLIYRRTIEEMPAIRKEVLEAFKEGVNFVFLTTPVKVLSDNGRISGLRCQKMTLGDYDESGRRRPAPVKGSEFELEIDTFIPAIGEEPDLKNLIEGTALSLTSNNTLAADRETLATEVAGVFAAGDCVTGPSTIADAIGQGKLAAVTIQKHLTGEPLEREYRITGASEYVPPLDLSEEEMEELSGADRPEMPTIELEGRSGNFDVVELGLSENLSVREARRCFRCDIR
jgi:NADH-quinone oxidoreductase subunit F